MHTPEIFYTAKLTKQALTCKQAISIGDGSLPG